MIGAWADPEVQADSVWVLAGPVWAWADPMATVRVIPRKAIPGCRAGCVVPEEEAQEGEAPEVLAADLREEAVPVVEVFVEVPVAAAPVVREEALADREALAVVQAAQVDVRHGKDVPAPWLLATTAATLAITT